MRERRSKSAWNLLLVPLCIVGIAGAWIGIVLAFQRYRGLLCPADAFIFSGTHVGNIFLYVAPFWPSLAFGLIVGNLLLWCVPPARTAMEREAAGAEDKVYRASQLALAKLGAVFAGIALPLCFLGANNFWALTAVRIYYRPMFAVTTRDYDWSSLRSVETGCSTGKTISFHFVVTLGNKTSIDLMEESAQKFWAAYPQIQAALRGRRYEFSSAGLVGRCVTSTPRRWLEILSKHPTE